MWICIVLFFSVILVLKLIDWLMNDAKMLMTNSQLQSLLTKECVYSEEMPDFCQIHMSHLLIC